MRLYPRFLLAPEGETILGGGGASTAAATTSTTQQSTQQAATSSASTSEAPTRPAWVPEKFWDATKGETNTEQLGSAYISLEKQFSSKRTLTPPLPGDPPEKVEAYAAELRKLTGAPDKPEGYGIKKPEQMPEGVQWNDEHANKLAAVAHKHALPLAAVNDLLALKLELEQGSAGQAKANLDTYVQGQKEQLQTAWKGDFGKNLSSATAAAKQLGVDLSDPDLGNNAKVIQVLHKASLLMREDKMLGGLEGSSKSSIEQIEEIRRGDAYQGKQGSAAQKAAADRMALLSGIKV